MYDTSPTLDLKYMKSLYFHRHYNSKEEGISESELGGQEKAFCPVESYKATGTCDSDTSADKLPSADEEKAAHFARLLPPYSSARLGSRPGSMDTAKRSSATAFAADSYNFDYDDEMIIELPSQAATSPMTSLTFLQPAAYLAPESPISMQPLSRSSSPTSLLSDDDIDVLVAEHITLVKPCIKPNLILIRPASEQSAVPFQSASAAQVTFRENDLQWADSSDAELVYSLTQATKSQPALDDFQQDIRSASDTATRGSLQLSLRGYNGQQTRMGAEAAGSKPLASMVEVSEQTRRPMSVRLQSISFARRKSAFSEKSASSRSRSPTAGIRRPLSLQRLSSIFHSQHTLPSSLNDSHTKSLPSSNSNASSECSVSSPTTSPTTYDSSPNFTWERSGSVYSPSSRTPLPIRTSMMKSLTSSSLYSGNSFRSDVESVHSLPGPEQRGGDRTLAA